MNDVTHTVRKCPFAIYSGSPEVQVLDKPTAVVSKEVLAVKLVGKVVAAVYKATNDSRVLPSRSIRSRVFVGVESVIVLGAAACAFVIRIVTVSFAQGPPIVDTCLAKVDVFCCNLLFVATNLCYA